MRFAPSAVSRIRLNPPSRLHQRICGRAWPPRLSPLYPRPAQSSALAISPLSPPCFPPGFVPPFSLAPPFPPSSLACIHEPGRLVHARSEIICTSIVIGSDGAGHPLAQAHLDPGQGQAAIARKRGVHYDATLESALGDMDGSSPGSNLPPANSRSVPL